MQFDYNARGQLVDVQGRAITAAHTQEGDLLVRAYRPLDGEGSP